MYKKIKYHWHVSKNQKKVNQTTGLKKKSFSTLSKNELVQIDG